MRYEKLCSHIIMYVQIELICYRFCGIFTHVSESFESLVIMSYVTYQHNILFSICKSHWNISMNVRRSIFNVL